MKKVLSLILVAIFFIAGCSEKSVDQIMREADDLFVNMNVSDLYPIKSLDEYMSYCKDKNKAKIVEKYLGEMTRKRERIEELYDQVLRKIESGEVEGYTLDEINRMKAKANFAIAFLRTIDFMEKLGGLLKSQSGEGSSGLDLSKYGSLIKQVLETSLLPIIKNYDEALSYGDFSYTFKNAWIDFSSLVSASAGRFVLNLSHLEVDNTDAYLINGLLKGIGGIAELLLAYNKLIDVIVSYSKYFSDVYDKTKIFNMIPGRTNPLLDPEFGVFAEDGLDSLRKAQELLAGMFADLRDGFSYLITDEVLIDPEQWNDLINLGEGINRNEKSNSKPEIPPVTSYAAGMPWGSNLLNSIEMLKVAGDPASVTSLQSNIETLKSTWSAISSYINLNVIIDMFEDLRNSTVSLEAPPFSITYYIYRLKLDSVLPSLLSVNIEELNLPGIRLAGLFETPISDLKTVLPKWYLESEPVIGDKDGDGRIDSYGEWVDLNKNGKWDQAGDFISQPEREPCFVNVAGTCSASNWNKTYDDTGILGTFIDRDRDGLPDAGYEGYLYGAGDGKFNTGNDKFDDTDLKVGEILGHKWPDGSRNDPSDGVVEENYYLFFPDPTFHGVLVPVEVNKEKLTYRETGKAMTNADLNALITRLGHILPSLSSGL